MDILFNNAKKNPNWTAFRVDGLVQLGCNLFRHNNGSENPVRSCREYGQRPRKKAAEHLLPAAIQLCRMNDGKPAAAYIFAVLVENIRLFFPQALGIHPFAFGGYP